MDINEFFIVPISVIIDIHYFVSNVTDSSDAFLVISNRRSILIADIHQRTLERVPVLVENVVATASDMKNGTLFWSDMKVKQIVKLEKGGEPEVVSYSKRLL